MAMAMALPVTLFIECQRMDVAVAYPAQGNHLAGAILNSSGGTAKNDRLQAMVMVQMDMQAADYQIMVLVLNLH